MVGVKYGAVWLESVGGGGESSLLSQEQDGEQAEGHSRGSTVKRGRDEEEGDPLPSPLSSVSLTTALLPPSWFPVGPGVTWSP